MGTVAEVPPFTGRVARTPTTACSARRLVPCPPLGSPAANAAADILLELYRSPLSAAVSSALQRGTSITERSAVWSHTERKQPRLAGFRPTQTVDTPGGSLQRRHLWRHVQYSGPRWSTPCPLRPPSPRGLESLTLSLTSWLSPCGLPSPLQLRFHEREGAPRGPALRAQPRPRRGPAALVSLLETLPN